jgi:hypothetical protein
MAYYIRVLGRNDKAIKLSVLENRLSGESLKAKISLTKADNNDWIQLTISNSKKSEIIILEKEMINRGSENDEIGEFKNEILDYYPRSAVKWLIEYFDKIVVIYSFQLLSSLYHDEKNWAILNCLIGEIRSNAGGIIQADGEGFSNEDGYHILWQFSDDVTGLWNMAILDKSKKWIAFQMDLANKEQRKALQNGELPKGVKLI